MFQRKQAATEPTVIGQGAVIEGSLRVSGRLENKDYEIVFPRRLAWAMKALRLMPNALFFWVVRTFMLKS
jgi:hypothetical protein